MEALVTFTLVDYVLLAMLVTGLIAGLTRGFIELLTGFIAFFVATVVAGRYSQAVLQFINRYWGLQEYVAGVLKRRISLPAEAYVIQANQIPWETAVRMVSGLPLPTVYKEMLAQRIVEWSQTAGTQSAAEFILQQLAAGILGAIVFLLMVVLVTYLLSLLGKLISDQVKEIPLVGMANRLLGGALSTLEVAVSLAFAIALFVPLLSMWGMTSFANSVQDAYLAPYFLALYDGVKGVLFDAGGSLFLAA
jgi:uncharacterized membrane protein required for colicin V production